MVTKEMANGARQYLIDNGVYCPRPSIEVLFEMMHNRKQKKETKDDVGETDGNSRNDT